MKVWMAPIVALTLANSAYASPLPAPPGKPDVVVEFVPSPTTAFFCGALPGGGQLYLGDTVKGSVYLGSSVLGGILGYALWNMGGTSPIQNDSEVLASMASGIAGFCVVGLVGAIDAALTANNKSAVLEADLEAQ